MLKFIFTFRMNQLFSFSFQTIQGLKGSMGKLVHTLWTFLLTFSIFIDSYNGLLRFLAIWVQLSEGVSMSEFKCGDP